MWKEEITHKLNRKTAEITFDPHLFDRAEYWNVNLNKVEEAVRTGSVAEGKCEEPNKLCFERYFGKEKVTYVVIVRYHEDFIEVKTVWPRKGR